MASLYSHYLCRFLLALATVQFSLPLEAQWEQLHHPCPASNAPNQAPSAQNSGDLTPPEVLSKMEPQFSEEARKMRVPPHLSVLSLTVGANGQACNLRIVSPAGAGLDENAIATVRQWRFRPAMRNGVPVPFDAVIEVNFSNERRLADLREPDRSLLNNSLAQVRSGTPAEKSKGIAALESLVQKNYPPAQAFYGLMLLEGSGVRANPLRGFAMVHKANQSNSLMGVFALGLAYLEGLGTPPDRAKALELLTEAALGGLPEAMLKMGATLSEGKASAIELEAAEYYLRRCAVLQNSACAWHLADVLSRRPKTPQRSAEALAWALRAQTWGADSAAKLVRRLDGPHRKEAELLTQSLPSYRPQPQ
jgi:TonB family protein